MIVTKEIILSELALLDLARLEKLSKYSQLLIIPDEDLLVSATMSQMYEKAMSLADDVFPEWTDRSESDFGRFLVELFSLFSEKDFWYINAYANESLISKMSVYSDAFTKAVSFGYDPVVCKGASALFNVVFVPGDLVTYKRGDLIIRIPSKDTQFTNDEPFNIPASSAPTVLPITLMEGSHVLDNVTFNGHSIIESRKMVDIESINITSNDVTWVRTRTFGRSSALSHHFIVVPETLGEFTAYFGEDGYGKKPDISQAMQVRFRVCKGAEGNFALQTTSLVAKSNSLRSASGAIMVTPSGGGTTPETIASIRNNIPLYFSSKKAAINALVTESILNTFSEVKRSKVTVVGNNVYFRIIPVDGSIASSALLETIQQRIFPLMVLGYNCIQQVTSYITVSPVTMDVFILPGYDVINAKSLVTQLVEDFTNPLVLAEYGASFDLSKLSLLIKSKVPGVQNVIFNTVAALPAANIIVTDTQILQKINPLTGLTISMYVV